MKFRYNQILLLILLSFFTNVNAENINIPGGGTNISMSDSDADQEPDPQRTPIDMYEGVLMIVATSMIAGYYFVRNRKQVS